ncbi:MAG: glutathione S-transferase family protein [Brachymonas sp.]|nr:glutathione S-transferase family protein [Brachymonas sp.]
MHLLTLYTHPHSRGATVRWMLEECGASYQTVPVHFGTEMKSPAYLAINPMGKSPALKVGDTVLTEAAAIITFLAEQYPDKHLIPAASSLARGEYYRWLCFALHCEYAMMDRWHGISNDDARRRAIGYGDFDSAINTLSHFLHGKTFALDEHFSALDLYLSGLIGWGMFRAQVLPTDGVLARYAQQHIQRPAFLRAQALDQALAEEMGLTAR